MKRRSSARPLVTKKDRDGDTLYLFELKYRNENAPYSPIFTSHVWRYSSDHVYDAWRESENSEGWELLSAERVREPHEPRYNPRTLIDVAMPRRMREIDAENRGVKIVHQRVTRVGTSSVQRAKPAYVIGSRKVRGNPRRATSAEIASTIRSTDISGILSHDDAKDLWNEAWLGEYTVTQVAQATTQRILERNRGRTREQEWLLRRPAQRRRNPSSSVGSLVSASSLHPGDTIQMEDLGRTHIIRGPFRSGRGVRFENEYGNSILLMAHERVKLLARENPRRRKKHARRRRIRRARR